jgi:hypothetical protein
MPLSNNGSVKKYRRQQKIIECEEIQMKQNNNVRIICLLTLALLSMLSKAAVAASCTATTLDL